MSISTASYAKDGCREAARRGGEEPSDGRAALDSSELPGDEVVGAHLKRAQQIELSEGRAEHNHRQMLVPQRPPRGVEPNATDLLE